MSPHAIYTRAKCQYEIAPTTFLNPPCVPPGYMFDVYYMGN